MKKNKILGIGLILILMMSTAACGSADKTVAKINNRVITVSELNQYFPIFLQSQYMSEDTLSKNKTQLNQMKTLAVDDLVNMEVVREYYDSKKINVIPSTAETEFNTFYKQLSTNEASKKFIADNKITEDFLKKMYFSKYYTSKLYNEITKEMGNTTSAALTYYNSHKQEFYKDEVRASHILVDTKEKADQILAQIKSGKDFATLAKENSKDTVSAQNGGDLGYFTKDKMIKAFSDAAFKLKVGEVSGVVQTEYGYHIIKCADKRSGYEPFKDASTDIINKLIDEQYMTKLKQIKSTMKVETYPKNYEVK